NIAIQDVSCFGLSDGSLQQVDIYGGTPPYEVDWADLDTTALAAGFYTAWITDAEQCVGTLEFTVNEPAPMEITWQAICENGLMSVLTNIAGGNFPFDYFWSNGMTTPSVSGLSDDTVLNLQITDDHGCVAIVEGIACPVGIGESGVMMPILSPNPAHDELSIISQIEMSGFEIFDIHGQKVYSASAVSFGYHVDISHLAPGHYAVLIRTAQHNLHYKLIIE
ncbi:MAG: hypothetical protein RL220_866, partial [Bacteroidota bacterium]